MTGSVQDFTAAILDFRRARRQANLREALGHLLGESRELLSYEEVRHKLHAVESGVEMLEQIPLDAIVGSVGRYNDFSRGFFPLQDSDEQRWARVRLAVTGQQGVPPIEVYQLGDAYFVKDGNHRVSVARQLGTRDIQAYVTPVKTRVPFTADDEAEDLILKEEHTSFLEETRLDELRPGADLSVTVPGQYQILLEHIEVHRYFMGLDEERSIPYQEAVEHWHDTVYLPVVDSIRRYGLLRGFENRTETDLYLWLAEHRARLRHELGWDLSSETIAENLGADRGLALERRPRVATVRAASGQQVPRSGERMFDDILVALSGTDVCWRALEHALMVAKREEARLYGLHVISSDKERFHPRSQEVRETFEMRCRQAGVEAQFNFSIGRVVDRILESASWVDLVVANLVHPPGPGLAARLSSGYQQLLRRSPRPLLAVPGADGSFTRVLLAYNASAKSEEALFVAAYIASRWRVPLVVVTVEELAWPGGKALDKARRYLEAYQLEASYLKERGSVAEVVVGAADEYECDLILMGSYRYNRWFETVLGGLLERVLRESERPVLIS
jgi:nucleotide-binding universal stress UspA family protein